jgi:hypothetical protein
MTLTRKKRWQQRLHKVGTDDPWTSFSVYIRYQKKKSDVIFFLENQLNTKLEAWGGLFMLMFWKEKRVLWGYSMAFVQPTSILRGFSITRGICFILDLNGIMLKILQMRYLNHVNFGWRLNTSLAEVSFNFHPSYAWRI